MTRVMMDDGAIDDSSVRQKTPEQWRVDKKE